MIPFIRDFAFEYGTPHRVSPLVHRVVARNPGRFTWTGTGTLIVGTDDVAVIDPGPDRDDHLAALDQAIDGRPVSCVLVTHNAVAADFRWPTTAAKPARRPVMTRTSGRMSIFSTVGARGAPTGQ